MEQYYTNCPNENKLLNVLNELDKSKGQVHSFACIDFKDKEKLKEKINLLKGIYHILINNTGGPSAGPIVDAKTKSFEEAFSMHLVNNQILVQKVIDGMKSEGYGRIVNVISTSVKAPIPGLGVSNTIRAAVANWAKTLSIELGVWNNSKQCITRIYKYYQIKKSNYKKS